MSSIVVRGLKKAYLLGQRLVPALRDVSLEIREGELAGIIGPSGSGKTTLLNIVGCLDRPDDGFVAIDGLEVQALDDARLTELRRRYIGFVFQDFNLVPVLSAQENVELPLLALGLPRKERHDLALGLLERVGMADCAGRRPDELSGGQQQCVAIARALSISPRLVIADEPTARLDGASGRRVLEIMLAVREELRTTFMLATHDPRVLQFLDRRVRLEDGRVASIEEKGA